MSSVLQAVRSLLDTVDTNGLYHFVGVVPFRLHVISPMS